MLFGETPQFSQKSKACFPPKNELESRIDVTPSAAVTLHRRSDSAVSPCVLVFYPRIDMKELRMKHTYEEYRSFSF